MSATFRLALAQINPRVGDLSGNTKKILNIITNSRGRHDVVLFPELALTGPRKALRNSVATARKRTTNVSGSAEGGLAEDEEILGGAAEGTGEGEMSRH